MSLKSKSALVGISSIALLAFIFWYLNRHSFFDAFIPLITVKSVFDNEVFPVAMMRVSSKVISSGHSQNSIISNSISNFFSNVDPVIGIPVFGEMDQRAILPSSLKPVCPHTQGIIK